MAREAVFFGLDRNHGFGASGSGKSDQIELEAMMKELVLG